MKIIFPKDYDTRTWKHVKNCYLRGMRIQHGQ